MSPITSIDNIEHYQSATSKPPRSFLRWLELETRSFLIAQKRRRRRRAGLRALHSMDDRMLADIGVDRGQIRAVVDGHK